MRVFAAAGMALMAAAQAAAAEAPRYAEGQVWEYRTRPGDEASLLKIQQIEDPDGEGPQEPIFHLSIIEADLGPGIAPTLPHVPVSGATLDASVTRPKDAAPPFPSPEEGIAEWRKAEGGVFSIPVAQIIGVARETLAQQPTR